MGAQGTAGMTKRTPDLAAEIHSSVSSKEIVESAKKQYEALLRRTSDSKGRNLWHVSFLLPGEPPPGTARMTRRLADGDHAKPIPPHIDESVWLAPPLANVMAWAQPRVKQYNATSYSISLEHRPEILKLHK